MKSPTMYELAVLIRAAGGSTQMSPDGINWYPARSEGFSGLRNRFRCAWAVFTGRADAVRWPGGQ